MSTVWAVSGYFIRSRNILRFLTEARCSARSVEVRLFKSDTLYSRTPLGSRRWQPCADLAKTAQEISQFITDNGSADATIIAADEI